MPGRALLSLAIATFVLVPPLWAAESAAPDTPPVPPRAALAAADCAPCHASVVEEWRTSMHAQSTKETNPLYRLVLAKAVATMGEGATAKCGRCHYPEWVRPGAAALSGDGTGTEGAKPASVAPAPPVEGVACVVCHVIDPKHPAERLPDGRHARLAGADVVRYGSEKLCLTCHRVLKSPDGHAVCTTGAESEEALVGNCTDCHMAEVKGAPTKGSDKPSHVSHAFPASRSERMLKSAASVSIGIAGAGTSEGSGAARTIVATVEPGEIGHYIPTGTPMRSMVLTVTAFGEDDEVLWRNHQGDPLSQAPEAVFQHVLTDAEGNRPVPAFLAKGKGDERRLKPEEPRTLRYPLPKGTKRVHAALVYHLAPAKVLEAAGVPDPWKKPVTVSEAEQSL